MNTSMTKIIAAGVLLFTTQAVYASTDSYEALLNELYPSDQPGAAVVISKQGEVIYSNAHGLAHLELPTPLQPNHMFRLASVTKQYVAAGILRLADEGKLSVEDTLDKFLPDFPDADQVTVHQLLNHTSGIKSYTGIEGYMTDERIRRDLSTAEIVEVFKDIDPDFAPGESFRYNNSGYVLLGAIIESITDMAWNEFLHTELLVPAGIPRTNYYADNYVLEGRVQGYHASNDGIINAPWISMSQPHAAGALIASAPEVDQWQYALHTGDILSENAYQQMITPDEVAGQYAYGLSTGSLKGTSVISHGGGINGFSTYAMWQPDHQISVVVLTNHIGHQPAPGTVSYRLAAIAMGDPFPHEQATVELTEAQQQRAVGTYRINDEETRTLQLRDGTLISQRNGGAEFEVRPVSETTYVFDTTLTYFDLVIENGTVSGVNFFQEGTSEPEYAEKISGSVAALDTVELTDDEKQRLLGSYELMPGFIITISLEEEQLFAQATGQGAFPVDAENDHTLSNSQYGIRMVFSLEDSGPATQMVLHQAGQQMQGTRVSE